MNAPSTSFVERRRFARVRLPEGAFGSLAPRTGRRVMARILDFSPGGVSLGSEAAAWLSKDGPLALRILGEEIPCQLAPESAERFRRSGADLPRLGVALVFEQKAGQDVARLYHRLRFPALRRRAEVPQSELRSLLADSGYMALRPDLEPKESWLRAGWPATLSHEAVFREENGRAIGHIAISRAYRSSWIGHEIAMLPRSADSLRSRRDLYQHFCVWPRLIDGEDTHVFGYYSPKRRFHQEMFEAFASRTAPQECVIARMERYMRHAETAPSDSSACLAGFSLEALTAEDEAEVLAMIERAWPALACVALDIGKGRLKQDRLHPAFAALGGRRARDCLILRARGRMIAALLCDWEDTGLSLFDALSVAHVFLAPGVQTTSSIEAAITSTLYEFYRARTATVPLFTCPPGTFQARDVPGFKWVETMGAIVFSARALRAFESHVEHGLDFATQTKDRKDNHHDA